jgi:hypothetical protein
MSIPREKHGKRGVSKGYHGSSTNKRGHKGVKHKVRRSLKKSIKREELKQVRGDNHDS